MSTEHTEERCVHGTRPPSACNFCAPYLSQPASAGERVQRYGDAPLTSGGASCSYESLAAPSPDQQQTMDTDFYVKPNRPSVGDRVEFVNDAVTDKGPSAGTVEAVARDGSVAVMHSDTVSVFDWRTLDTRWSPANDDRPALWSVIRAAQQPPNKETTMTTEQAYSEPKEWCRSFDARDWVKAWFEIIAEHPNVPHDKGTMLGWFANAIMAGYDKAKQEPASVDHSHDPRTCKECGER